MDNPIKAIAKKVKEATRKVIEKPVYSMDSPEHRQGQVLDDYNTAKIARESQDRKWIEYDNYYHNLHKTSYISATMLKNDQIPFDMPTLTDCFIQIESQIDPVVPSFQFKGRDMDVDSIKARQREDVVKYICYNNRLERLNVENDRVMGKYGNAFWKISWDDNIKGPGYKGDIVIGNPNPANIFPDPSARDIDECEYLMHVFRMHKRKAYRIWGDVVYSVNASASHKDTEILDREYMLDDETVQVIEYWFRQPTAGKETINKVQYEWEPGDIACSIQVENVEVQYIPNYWMRTSNMGNQSFPFVKYCRIPVEQSFWDLSEIASIKDLVDAADIEFINALLNDMYLGNDVVLVEEDAVPENETLDMSPGAVVKTRPNKINNVRRLGGVSNNANATNMIQFIHDKIQETTGNSESMSGLEPTRVTTASGIAQLNEQANARKSIKKYDRLKGFEELYKLVDMAVCEFYDETRMIMIRGNSDNQPDQAVAFNVQDHMMMSKDGTTYYPPVDIEITAGDGIAKSKAFTMQVMSDLINMPITVQNIALVEALIDILELPNAKELKQAIEQGLANAMQLQMQQQAQEQQATINAQNQQNNPQAEETGSDVNPDDVAEQLIQQMSPQQRQQFMQLGPDEQDQFLEQLMQQGQQRQGMPDPDQIADQILSTMTPEEMKIFKSKSPEEQDIILNKLIDQQGGQAVQ